MTADNFRLLIKICWYDQSLGLSQTHSRDSGLPGCAADKNNPSVDRIRRYRRLLPHRLPYLPAETPVIRVWATCRKNTYREHGVMDISNYAAILLMDATSSCCNDTHIHIRRHTHTHMMHMWIQWDHYRTKSGLILTYAYYLPDCHVSRNTRKTWCCLLLLFRPLINQFHLSHTYIPIYIIWGIIPVSICALKRV